MTTTRAPEHPRRPKPRVRPHGTADSPAWNGYRSALDAVSRLLCYACGRAGGLAVPGNLWNPEAGECEAAVLPMCAACRASLVARIRTMPRVSDRDPEFLPGDMRPHGDVAA